MKQIEYGHANVFRTSLVLDLPPSNTFNCRLSVLIYNKRHSLSYILWQDPNDNER